MIIEAFWTKPNFLSWTNELHMIVRMIDAGILNSSLVRFSLRIYTQWVFLFCIVIKHLSFFLFLRIDVVWCNSMHELMFLLHVLLNSLEYLKVKWLWFYFWGKLQSSLNRFFINNFNLLLWRDLFFFLLSLFWSLFSSLLHFVLRSLLSQWIFWLTLLRTGRLLFLLLFGH